MAEIIYLSDAHNEAFGVQRKQIGSMHYQPAGKPGSLPQMHTFGRGRVSIPVDLQKEFPAGIWGALIRPPGRQLDGNPLLKTFSACPTPVGART